MCGIIGYVGERQAAPILIEGLSKLEYRGYDSAGVAVITGDELNVKKAKGRLQVLSALTDKGYSINGKVGIGHTRWATHGKPSDVNSHPQVSGNGKFAVVHNGIIENYVKIKEKLTTMGVKFVSETDTEVLAHLFEYYYNGDMIETTINVIKEIRGSYAIGIVSLEFPNELIAVRHSGPLVVGVERDGNFVASDITAFLGHTNKICYLEDDEIAVLKPNCIKFYNCNKQEIKKEYVVADLDVSSAEKGSYEHFMLKEIEEQPKVISDTISSFISNDEIVFDSFSMTQKEINNIGKIHIVACGTAYHAGMVGKYIIEKLCRLPVEVSVSSEFRYCNPIIASDDLVIVISQSGETADTLAVLKDVKTKGIRTLAIVNVVGSAITKLADDVLYTLAGPEIAVASTKAYSTQLVVIYMLAVYIAYKSETINETEYNAYINDIKSIPGYVLQVLNDKQSIKSIASELYKCKSMFFIGRNIDYAVSLEGSLKLKEISYIHSEAYPAGELKHGTISLIEKGTPVIAITTISELFEKTLSNVKEVSARGAKIISVVNKNIQEIGEYVVNLPSINDLFMPSLSVIPLQLFAYYVALHKGCDIDKPRNLAKSVTVE